MQAVCIGKPCVQAMHYYVPAASMTSRPRRRISHGPHAQTKWDTITSWTAFFSVGVYHRKKYTHSDLLILRSKWCVRVTFSWILAAEYSGGEECVGSEPVSFFVGLRFLAPTEFFVLYFTCLVGGPFCTCYLQPRDVNVQSVNRICFIQEK